MKEYFQLQFKIINRKMIEVGIPLLVGYVGAPVVFVVLANYLFSKTDYASYLFAFVAVSVVAKLSEPRRNDFLKSIFNSANHRKLRVTENLLCATPFLLYFGYQQAYIFALVLAIIAAAMALFNFNINLNIAVPTPFGKKPFEFVVGFRKTFYLFPIAYFLTYMSVAVGNFNLGIFSFMLVTLTCLSYYAKPENEYFVWNYNLSPKAFLHEKIKTCFIFFAALSAPIVLAMSIFYFAEIDLVLLFFLLSFLYLAAFILTKYTAFPDEINIAQGIFIALCIAMPPLLLVIIPYLHAKAVKNLNAYLT